MVTIDHNIQWLSITNNLPELVFLLFVVNSTVRHVTNRTQPRSREIGSICRRSRVYGLRVVSFYNTIREIMERDYHILHSWAINELGVGPGIME
ncbi:unnamed protein product [Ceratitis capitata]|uniref:(Mediterranean fruit fly) hypothetical protein n=1 Tax=Ceratitis capitata TaxID=7213 RepID=A0A811U726_CERCA|nr:unnamed protein product [Ceratitis capitata]